MNRIQSPRVEAAIEYLREGDALVVVRLDRLTRARSQGITGGRRPTIAGQKALLVKRLAAEGLSIRQIAASIEASPSAVHRLLAKRGETHA